MRKTQIKVDILNKVVEFIYNNEIIDVINFDRQAYRLNLYINHIETVKIPIDTSTKD